MSESFMQVAEWSKSEPTAAEIEKADEITTKRQKLKHPGAMPWTVNVNTQTTQFFEKCAVV